MAKLDKKTRDNLKDSDFGIPSKRMYPIHDKAHVEAAVKLFGHASNEDKPELAHRILQKAKEFGMDSSGWTQVNLWAKKYKGESTNESTEEISDEKIVDSIANDESEKEDLTEGITEAAAGASLLTVKNQLMKMVGNAFKFIGGSLVPKFTMQSTEKPAVAFDVNSNGQNVEVTPKYNGVADTMHKRKGIAFMQAADTIANFVQDVVNRFTGTSTAAMESIEYYDEYFEALLEYADELMDECELEAYLEENPEMEFAICIGEDYLYDDEDFDAYFEGTEYDGEDRDIIIESDNVFTEERTYAAYDAYLAAHGYDPKTNTIIINGRRVSAGQKGTPKQRSRLNKFLARHNYDPETETIEVYEPSTGRVTRRKFSIFSQYIPERNSKGEKTGKYLTGDSVSPDENGDSRMFITKKTLMGKPTNAETTVGHEGGHMQFRPDRRGLNIYNPGTDFSYLDKQYPEIGSRARQFSSDRWDEREYSYHPDAVDRHDLSPEELAADTIGQMGARHYLKKPIRNVHTMTYQKKYERPSADTPSVANNYDQDSGYDYYYGISSAKELVKVIQDYAKEVAWDSDEEEARMDLTNYMLDYICDKIQSGPDSLERNYSSPKWMNEFKNDILSYLTQLRDKYDVNFNKRLSEYEQNEFYNKIIANLAQIGDFMPGIGSSTFDDYFNEILNILSNGKINSVSPDFLKKKSKLKNQARKIDKGRMVEHPASVARNDFGKMEEERLNQQDRQQAAQQRHLLRAQLQEQIDSGQLTPKQVQQAQKKIARIDAFDAREQSGASAPKPQPKKKAATSKSKKPSETASKKTETTKKASVKTEKPETAEKKAEVAPKKTEKPTPEKKPDEKKPAPAKPASAKKSETKSEETKK